MYKFLCKVCGIKVLFVKGMTVCQACREKRMRNDQTDLTKFKRE